VFLIAQVVAILSLFIGSIFGMDKDKDNRTHFKLSNLKENLFPVDGFFSSNKLFLELSPVYISSFIDSLSGMSRRFKFS
jgi:hypothetical protein